jgi:hypothetical protein
MEEALCRQPWDRVKGIVVTGRGWLTINLMEGVGALRPTGGLSAGRLNVARHEPLDGEGRDRRLRAGRQSMES